MTFDPKTEAEIFDGKLLPKGEYSFEIMEAFEKVSQSGNPMFELKVKVTRADGSGRMITDYVLPKRAEKLRDCCGACGILDKYTEGILAADDFIGKRGKLTLGVEKDKAKVYPPKNVVVSYVFAGSTSSWSIGLTPRK